MCCRSMQQCDTLKSLYHFLGDDSVIMRLLRVVNQSIVLCGMQELRTSVCRDIMTKDVRDKSGWRIQFRLGDVIQVITVCLVVI